MRAFAVGVMVLGFAVSPVRAWTGAAGDRPADKATEASSASANTKNTSNEPTAASKTDSPAKPAESSLEGELQELRDLIEAQSKQIQSQSEQLKEEQQQMQSLENRLKSAGVSAVAPASAAPAATPASTSSSSANLGALSPATAPAAEPISVVIADPGNKSSNAVNPQTGGGFDKNPEQTAEIHFKGITLTPGGYFAAETAFRQRDIGSDINSAFTAVPVPGQDNSHISNFIATGRQSRIAMRAEGKLSSVTIGGYYEGDFLSAGTTSNPNESNSYTFRQRQFWGQARFNSGWTVTGGQMWSLVTETRHGVDNLTEATTQTIDAQYHVGFSWARQYGLRFAKDFGNKFWLAAAVENAQTTVTVHGQNGNGNFLVGTFGTSGGLNNPLANYSYNGAPDFVVKAALEPGWGHFEVFGLVTTPKDRVYPCQAVSATTVCNGVTGPSGAGASNNISHGGGVGANARGRFFKHVDLGLHFLGGDGIGRYGSVGLPMATIHPDGTLALIRNYQGLGTIEVYTNKLDLYAYFGGEYDARTAYQLTPTSAIGYGSPLFNNSGCWTEPLPGAATSTATGVGGGAGYVPGSLSNCNNDIKNMYESTVGFWYRFYKGPMGTMQFGAQESYFWRYDWSGIGTKTGIGVTGAPVGNDNMVFTSFRYYIP